MLVLRVLAAAVLILGLAIGVLVTFFGVERRRGREIRRPHPAVNLPAIAAAMVAWGLIAYPLATRTGLGAVSIVLIALLAAGGAWAGTGVLLGKWALRAPLDDPHELAEILQGHVAVVTRRIGDQPGMITYQLHGESHVTEARSTDGRSISEGTDVVIDRIENGTVYVEPWSLVEPRL